MNKKLHKIAWTILAFGGSGVQAFLLSRTPISFDFRQLLDFTLPHFGLLFCFLLGFCLLFLYGQYIWNSEPSKKRFRYAYSICFVVYTTLILQLDCNRKIEIERAEMISRIISNQDTTVETNFRQMLVEMEQDSLFPTFIQQSPTLSSDDSLLQYIKEKYLDIFCPHYYTYLTLCTPQQELLLEDQSLCNCQDYFKEEISQKGDSTGIPGLYTIDYGIEYIAYLWTKDLTDAQRSVSIYLEIGREKFKNHFKKFKKFIQKDRGSYALYKEGNLLYHYGSASFPVEFKASEWEENEIYQDYHRLCIPLKNSQYFIYIHEIQPWYTKLYGLSFLVFCLLLFLACYTLIRWALPSSSPSRQVSLSRKLQFNTLSIIFICLIGTAVVSLYFIHEINRKKNEDLLREKALVCLTELENTDAELSDWEKQIHHFSELLFTHILIYDTLGQPLLSANEYLSENSPLLQAHSMDSSILQQIKTNKSNYLLVEEKADFLSIYLPIKNKSNQTLAYLHLPYYNQKDEWKQEINAYITAYLNLLVLILLLTLLLNFLLSNSIIRPLRLLSVRLGEIQPGKENKAIQWKGQDEIGRLIAQYNQLILELEESSRKLAQSEREGAWQEMARQIAHEIKNPLTPIKLQVQQLERAYLDRKNDFDQRLHHFKTMLVHQVDLMTEIANSFSQFAQWGQPTLTSFPVQEVIQKECSLFQNENTIFHIETHTEKDSIMADLQWTEQIFHNLFKNAIQSIEEAGVKGRIDLLIQDEITEDYLEVIISDNGKGIAEENKERIFEPHFTTKSNGSGIGLSISKKLIESMGGKISFQPQSSGCSFRLLFKKD